MDAARFAASLNLINSMSKKTDWLATAQASQSKDFRDKNPHLFGGVTATDFSAKLIPSLRPKKPGKRRKEMNKTEARFAALLDARAARGEIVSWAYEEITLRWPDAMRYTPDFVVIMAANNQLDIDPGTTVLIEVKGAHAWAKDVVKFRAARDKWGDRFRFEWWQEVDGVWRESR